MYIKLAADKLNDIQQNALQSTRAGGGGVWSCVEAGIAAGLLGTEALSRTVVPVEQVAARCASHIVLRRARGAVGPACEAMVAAIRRAFV